MKRFMMLLAGLLVLPAVALGDGDDAAREKTFITNARQLTYEGKRAGEGYFSHDGKYLIFQSERDADNPFYQIFALSFESGESHRVSPGSGKTTCAFFRPPGHDEVLFASTHLDPEAVEKQKAELEFRASGKERRYSWDYDPHYDVFSASLDGSNIERLTDTPGYDAEASYSPDGKLIVFCSLRDAVSADALSEEDKERMEIDPSYFGEIYIMNADGSDPKRLTDWPGYDGGPFFAPDGDRIVWRHFAEDGATADIYTMKLDGSDRRRLTDFGAMSWAPFFHPSGKYAIFTTNKHGFGNFELYIVDAMGHKQPVRITYTDGFDGLPVFSPDGKTISWTANRTPMDVSQIFIGQWNHGAALEALETAARRAPARGATQGAASQHGRAPGVTRAKAAAVRADARYTVAGNTDGGAADAEATSSNDGADLSEAVSQADLRAHVSYLASDELEGRMTGTTGTELAREYIRAQFEQMGLQPMGDGDSYYQEFPFTSGIEVVTSGNSMSVTDTESGAKAAFDVDVGFRPLAFSENGTVEGEVVFCGYGLKPPGEGEDGYNSYSGVDVDGKIALVLRYVPEEVDTKRRQQLNMYAGLRYKAVLARENGASALLVVTGPNSPNAGELVPLRFDQSLADSGIPVATISADVAAKLFAHAEKSLEEIQSGLDVENPHTLSGFVLPNVTVNMTTEIKRNKSTGRNVLGYLPPGGDGAGTIVLGAHYDHIGRGEVGSLAKSGEEGQIHNGADDNASGTATVLELAAALAAARAKDPSSFKYGVLVALWSGEELGIIGSNYFAENPTVPLDDVIAYLNFDMVGRLRENRLMLQGVGSSSVWRGMIEKRNVMAGFDIKINDDPYLPTDVTAFYPKGVPVLSFFTGPHEDYNRPTDDASTLNYEGMERIGQLAEALAMDLQARDDRLDYVKVERIVEKPGQGAALRAYLGTIPDYAGGDEINGVKLSGVRAGGPAEKAGLMGGDIIVMFGGQKIANIYDYTYALGAVKIGEPVEVVVMRDGEEKTLTVIPEARK